ncbi:hypothetical protein FC683_32720, partial [Bacillus cereus]
TVTTAGILLTSITPSFAAEQKENPGKQISPIQEQQNQAPDELKVAEAKQEGTQTNNAESKLATRTGTFDKNYNIGKAIPEILQVNEVTDQDTEVTGTTNRESLVTILGVSTNIITDKSGNFIIPIPKQPGGTKLVIQVCAFNYGWPGDVITQKEITVKATVPEAPEVNEVTDKDTKVTGKAQPGAH